jgi:methionyl aminopeptidase
MNQKSDKQMPDTIFDSYCQAGKIAAKILKEGAGLIRPGSSYLEVVEAIETMVDDEGAGLAFPLNVSFNEDAAHDTASTGDPRIFSPGDIVKLDLGVHLDGYIADTACTIDLGNNKDLLQASKEALNAAISCVRPGALVGELGYAIQDAITSRGFNPIVNLTGHGLGQYQLHLSPNIPNFHVSGGSPLEEGMVFAIEPFASTGSGHVSEKRRTEIFCQVAVKPVRTGPARRIVDLIRKRRGLPFARRWIKDSGSGIALSTLQKSGIIRSYPVLSDIPGSIVSQHEHTVIVTENGCIVTTL